MNEQQIQVFLSLRKSQRIATADVNMQDCVLRGPRWKDHCGVPGKSGTRNLLGFMYYTLTNEVMRASQMLLRTCDNSECVNPYHYMLVSKKDAYQLDRVLSGFDETRLHKAREHVFVEQLPNPIVAIHGIDSDLEPHEVEVVTPEIPPCDIVYARAPKVPTVQELPTDDSALVLRITEDELLAGLQESGNPAFHPYNWTFMPPGLPPEVAKMMQDQQINNCTVTCAWRARCIKPAHYGAPLHFQGQDCTCNDWMVPFGTTHLEYLQEYFEDDEDLVEFVYEQTREV